MNTVSISVTGSTQIGKSSILREIKDHLESLNLAVVYSSPEHRNNPPADFKDSAHHEKPNPSNLVIVLTENTQ